MYLMMQIRTKKTKEFFTEARHQGIQLLNLTTNVKYVSPKVREIGQRIHFNMGHNDAFCNNSVETLKLRDVHDEKLDLSSHRWIHKYGIILYDQTINIFWVYSQDYNEV